MLIIILIIISSAFLILGHVKFKKHNKTTETKNKKKAKHIVVQPSIKQTEATGEFFNTF